MGLADEIMQMAEEYALLRESNIRGRTRQKHRERLRSRLSALEHELASLRMDALQAESQRLGLYDDLDASHSFSALPCPSEYVNAQTGYDDEDGG